MPRKTTTFWSPFLRTTLDPVNEAGLPHIDQVVIAGPYNATGPGDTPSRRKIFVCTPSQFKRRGGLREEDSDGAGARSLSASDHSERHGDAAELLPGRAESREAVSTQASSARCGLILSSPEFVFRFERDPSTVADGRLLSH